MKWIAAVVLLTVWPHQPPAAELPDTVAKVKPSIVGIGTVQLTRRPPGNFVGTGFVVADGLHVITNAHNMPAEIDTQNREFLAILPPGDKSIPRPAVIVARDDVHDLALLRFDGPALPAMTIADSTKVREGELFAFSGYPIGIIIGMRPVTHRGIISAITPIAIPQNFMQKLDASMIKRLSEPYDVFQLDATAYPGNSGSPLYRIDDGKVVGVVNKVFIKESKEALLEKPSGISYAIPSQFVTALLKKAGL